MNNLADELKGDLTKTANDIKKDVEVWKNDIKIYKKEMIDPVILFFKERRALKWLRNIQAFGMTVKGQRILQHGT